MQKVPAAQFKAKCLSMMEQVSETGEPIVVTKHGKPVVRVVPVGCENEEIFGFLSGKAKIAGDVEESAPLSDWQLK